VKTPSVKQAAQEDPEPHIQFSEEHRIIEVRDRRLFRRGHEAFCRRLVKSAVKHLGIRSATVTLGSATCRLHFASGRRTAKWMATQFVEILQEAVPVLARSEARAEGGFDWATVSAFQSGQVVSCWEVRQEAPDRLRLHNELLYVESSLARQVAKALREVPGIASSGVVSYGHDLRVAYDPSQRASLAVVEAAETCLQRIRLSDAPPADPREKQIPGRKDGQSQRWFEVFAMRRFALPAL